MSNAFAEKNRLKEQMQRADYLGVNLEGRLVSVANLKVVAALSVLAHAVAATALLWRPTR